MLLYPSIPFYGSFDGEWHGTECPRCGVRFSSEDTWPVCVSGCGYVDPAGLTPERVAAAGKWLDKTLPMLADNALWRGDMVGADYLLPIADAWSIVRAYMLRESDGGA